MTPKAIVVHCSASRWGDVETFRQWHREKGWSDIGYHAVILNGRRTSMSAYERPLDGKIEPGRADNVMGAHCKADGMNAKSLGVCLVGDPTTDKTYPTKRQLDALVHYLATKCREHGIPASEITQHSDHEPAKPFCASVDLHSIRRRVQGQLG